MKRENQPTKGASLPPIPALILSVFALMTAAAQSAPALDAGFKPVITRTGGLVSAVGIQSDGKIVVAGAFNAIDGIARNGLVRLNEEGSVDQTFTPGSVCCATGLDDPGSAASISDLTIQKDGKILIGGAFSEIGGVARGGLARLNSDGSLDPTFDPGSGLASTAGTGSLPAVMALVEQPDGKIIVGGFFTAINRVKRDGLARINPDGTVDTGFDPGTALAIGSADFGALAGVALLKDGKILVGGAFSAFNDTPRAAMARLNADGSLDGTFDPALYQREARPTLDAMLVQPDGQILVSGSFYLSEPEYRENLARLNPDATIDKTFNLEFDPTAESYRVLGLQADGKILVFRQFSDASGNAHRTIGRLNTNGSLDPSFNVELAPGEGVRLQVLDTAVQSDGKLLVAGDLAPESDSAQQGIFRADNTGNVDATFDPQLELAEGFDANVLALAVQTDGKAVIGGAFTTVNGTVRAKLARLNRDGALDSSFAPVIESGPATRGVSAILLQADGKFLVGGDFSTVNGVSRNGIARLNADGSLDTSFDPGSGTKEGDPAGEGPVGRVATLALQPDGKVLVAGSFTTLNGQPVAAFGRLNADGTFDSTFNSGVGQCAACDIPNISEVRVLTNDFIVVSGDFEKVDAFTMPRLARIKMDGTIDLAFTPPINAGDQVTAMVVSPDSKVTAAISFFDSAAETNKTRLVRLNADGTLDAGFTPGEVLGSSAEIPVSALALDGQGRLVLAGEFQSIGGVPRQGLARLNADGTLDAGFDAGAGFGNGSVRPTRTLQSLVTDIALQSDGGILVGGAFGTADNQIRLGLARYQDGPPGPSGGEPRLSAGTWGADGSFTVLVAGDAGRSYRIEASNDLRTWSPVGNVTGAATPQALSDPGAKSASQRFYRAVGL